MESIKPYENYPFPMVLIAFLVTISIYALGFFIVSGLGYAAAIIFLLFCSGLEISIMKKSCVDCFYYGRSCALGRGKVAPFFFKRGDASRFAARCISWKDLLPDMLVLLIPLVAGTALLIRDFTWSRVMMLAGLLALSFGGNYFIRSSIACKYCKQREIGCPAEKLFSGER